MMDDIYQVNIIDHYKNPRHFGDLLDFTHKGRGANASCGDMVEIYLKIENGKISGMSFKGIGCALSTAAASMLTEKIVDQKTNIEEIQSMSMTDMAELLGIEVSPTRMKCVALPLRALQDILEKEAKSG